MSDATEQFRDALSAAGLVPPDRLIADGKIHRCDAADGKKGNGAGTYKLHLDGVPAGGFCNWRGGEWIDWCAKVDRQLTAEERAAHRRRMDEQRAEAAAEAQRRQEEAAAEAATLLAAAFLGEHDYLARKSIQAHGVKVFDGALLIPARDTAGTLWTLQKIHADGKKRFLTGGRKAGCYFAMGRPDGLLILCEGFATGATINETTGHAVAVCFDCGNILAVAQALRAKFPSLRFAIAADDDHATEGNPGVSKATAAANAVGADLIVPDFSGVPGRTDKDSDFNDLARLLGADAVRDQFARALTPIQAAPASEPPPAGPEDYGMLPDDDGEPVSPEFSDDALGLRFTARFGTILLYVAAWGKWLIWTGTYWREETTLQAWDLARAVCREAASMAPTKTAAKIASSATVSAVEKLVRSDRRHARTSDIWDADPWLLNTPAGTVDLHTGKMRGNRPDDHLTKITAVGPGGECPSWLRFLNGAMAGDQQLVGFLQRMAGYSLTGSTRDHALFFAYGTGGNGKGVFINTLSNVMGDYAATSAMETFTASVNEGHPTDLAKLRGARLVTAQETEEGRQWAEAKIKALTGGDKISARFMRQDFFEFIPQFKLLIAGNHKPSLRNVDEAMKRRFHVVPFTVTVPPSERDPDLPEKLKAEWPGILKWAIEGCLEWQRIGLAPPAAVTEATREYLEAEDSFSLWMGECLKPSTFAFETSADLYASWKKWAEAAGEQVGSQKRFSQNLTTKGAMPKRQAGTGKMGFEGFQLNRRDYSEDSRYAA